MTVIPDAVYERAAEQVVPILQAMVGFDTTIAQHDDPPKDEQGHQEMLAARLRAAGVEVELFEPAEEEFRDHPMYRPNQRFDGRPILWGRLAGSGDGPSLLFNGHMDTVVADPVEDWTSSPWSGEVRDGRLYGRGSCDMKGGIACAVAVAEALAGENVKLPGDLYFNFAPFEEVNGMGTTATVLRGYRADASICCEPTELNTLVACRGVLLGRLEVTGRSAHAEIPQPHHSVGGGVNSIEKLIQLLGALARMNEDWRNRPDKQHDLLSTPSVLTTMIGGGAFASNWPAASWAILNCCYLPAEGDEHGYGPKVKAEIEACLQRAANEDSWLREHQPQVEWLCDFPAGEIERDSPLVATVEAAAQRQGLVGSHLIGFDTWADQVTLLNEARIPTVCFGPGAIVNAHAVDEYVPVSDLEACTRVFIDAAATWTSGSHA